MIDVEKLKKLHEDATPGEWTSDRDLPHNRMPRVHGGDGSLICEVGNMGTKQDQWEDDAALIAFLCSHSARAAILAMAEREKRQREEIARLKLELEVKDCLADGQYKAGVKAGWNLCADGDEEGLQRITGDTSHIAELNRLRALGEEKA